jgi:flagellar basal body-associated protein FliL
MKKIGLIVGVVVVLAGIGGGVYWFLLGGSEKFAGGEHEEPKPVHVEGRLGPHIVLKERVFNLAAGPGGAKHYLKLGTSIEFETTDPEWYELAGEPLTKALEEFDHEEIGSGRLIIEDIITTIVSGKRVEDVASAEGKDHLREEIRAAIAHHIAEPLVHRVLFTSFITD